MCRSTWRSLDFPESGLSGAWTFHAARSTLPHAVGRPQQLLTLRLHYVHARIGTLTLGLAAPAHLHAAVPRFFYTTVCKIRTRVRRCAQRVAAHMSAVLARKACGANGEQLFSAACASACATAQNEGNTPLDRTACDGWIRQRCARYATPPPLCRLDADGVRAVGKGCNTATAQKWKTCLCHNYGTAPNAPYHSILTIRPTPTSAITSGFLCISPFCPRSYDPADTWAPLVTASARKASSINCEVDRATCVQDYQGVASANLCRICAYSTANACATDRLPDPTGAHSRAHKPTPPRAPSSNTSSRAAPRRQVATQTTRNTAVVAAVVVCVTVVVVLVGIYALQSERHRG